MGPLPAAAVFLGLGASASLLAWGLGGLLSALPSPSLTRSGRLAGAGCTAALVIVTTALPAGWWGEQSDGVAELPGALGWPTARFSVEQARGVGRLLAERDAFAVEDCSLPVQLPRTEWSPAAAPGTDGSVGFRGILWNLRTRRFRVRFGDSPPARGPRAAYDSIGPIYGDRLPRGADARRAVLVLPRDASQRSLVGQPVEVRPPPDEQP